MHAEKVFGEVLEKKNKNFIDYRNVDIKSPQICIFQTGLVHGFCQKLRFLHVFFLCRMHRKKVKKKLFLCNMGREKIIGEVLERKWNVLSL